MNLSAKGGETGTYQNVFEARYSRSAMETTVDRHPLANRQQPQPVRGWSGNRPSGMRVRAAARRLKGTPVKLF